jgi:hypothetical protein
MKWWKMITYSQKCIHIHVSLNNGVLGKWCQGISLSWEHRGVCAHIDSAAYYTPMIHGINMFYTHTYPGDRNFFSSF